jgi:heme exporter protein C
MKFRDDIYLGITAVANLLAIYFALYIAPAEVELGELVRVFYFHLPGAIATYITLILSAATAIAYLIKKDYRLDAFSQACALLGLIYGLITLIGGAVWANATWGVYWNWDPRETTTLILWLAYLGYFFLRMSVENVERRASVSAVYNILAVLTVPLSYMSFILWPSLHPRLSEGGGLGLTGTMVQALLMNMFSGMLFMGWLIRKAYKVQMSSDQLQLKLVEAVQNAD